MGVALPEPVRDALRGHPTLGAEEPAHVFLTVSGDGYPHVCLLSRAEVEPDVDHLRWTLAGTRTPQNLERAGIATLVVVAGTTVYSIDLAVQRHIERARMHGYRGEVLACHEDSLGIPLRAITFVAPPELPSLERWGVSAALLSDLG